MLDDTEVTALEAILDSAIIKSQEEDDGDPVCNDVSIDIVNPLADKLVQANVYASLSGTKRGRKLAVV